MKKDKFPNDIKISYRKSRLLSGYNNPSNSKFTYLQILLHRDKMVSKTKIQEILIAT